jgi:hypothetical protein
MYRIFWIYQINTWLTLQSTAKLSCLSNHLEVCFLFVKDAQPGAQRWGTAQHVKTLVHATVHPCKRPVCLRLSLNCQNPNSTYNSIEQKLHSYPVIHHTPTTTNSLFLLLTAPASQAGKLYNYTVREHKQPLCTMTLDFKVTILIFFVSEFKKLGRMIKRISIIPLDIF